MKRLEQSAAHFKAAAGKAEQHRAAGAREIVKGNKIIQRLRQDAQAAKRKAKLRLGVIAQQEAALREKEALQGKQRSRPQVAQAKAELERRCAKTDCAPSTFTLTPRRD